MLSENTQQRLVKLLSERVNPAFILLFGSYAKGLEREDSDIDLAYYSTDLLAPYEHFLLSGELAKVSKTEVDVVNIRELDTVFAMQIFSTGKLLACKDENEFVKQRMKAFSMYADLSEQRAEILQNIQDRGSVYGNE